MCFKVHEYMKKKQNDFYEINVDRISQGAATGTMRRMQDTELKSELLVKVFQRGSTVITPAEFIFIIKHIFTKDCQSPRPPN